MDVTAFPDNLETTSGLSILLHGVTCISLPAATSYDNVFSVGLYRGNEKKVLYYNTFLHFFC